MDELYFRQFNGKDMARCSEIAVDVWPIVSALVPKENAVEFMSACVEISRLWSTWLEVACILDTVVGLLFGRIDTDRDLITELKTSLSYWVIGMKLIFQRYGRLSKPFTFLRRFISTQTKARRSSPKSDAEVTLFVVDSKYRGRGIGKALMDRFIDTAREKGVRVIMLYTGPMNNWRFYERYGFKRCGTFDDDLSSYLKNEDMKGFIYAMDIQ
jgi:ribosomal protein S18 acetylase RimI-like enzyme